ncbi:MAG: RNA-directed DNA polymerase [bacterium]|nr:RNA-directed DNA polymerase [bacterium]
MQLEPIFERCFIPDSYANRVGKGTHRALDRCQQFARTYRYVLPCDIRQFFPSIDHQILFHLLTKKIQDEDVLWLIAQILMSGQGVLRESYQMVYFPGDDLLSCLRPRGLPIGNLTSQFWANVYLHGLDLFIKRELGCRAHVRFVDDFLLFSDEKVLLWQWKQEISRFLHRLRLTIHAHAQPKPVTEGIPFLGFVVYPNTKRIKRRKGVYFRRRFLYLVAAYEMGDISFAELDASVKGWINHVRYANSVGLRKAILSQHPINAPRLRGNL